MLRRLSIVIVDQFYELPMTVRQRALNASYQQPQSVEGWRSRPYLALGIRRRIETLLNVRITDWGDDRTLEGANGSFFCAFSKGRLAERPGVHWDGPSSMRTGLVYLTPEAPADAGTSFWLHRPTGLITAPDRADAKRLGSSVAALEALLERDARNSKAWEETDRVANRFNRAVFFAPNLLHSASRHFGQSVKMGRLYQSFHFTITAP